MILTKLFCYTAQNSIEFLPSTIGQLANLSILKLEQNQLVVLTPAIGKCSQLTELIVTENLLSELPHTIGNLRLLTNLNVDRNRLTYIPDEVCDCENIGLLFCRDNQISLLPDNIGRLQRLKVLDVAGNKLSYLPYSLTNANLNAIWLAENQATGKIKLQPDFDEATQKEVLTCYLLPQQNFHTPSMENLLQGSINTAENASQGIHSASSPVQRAQNTESVRFAPEDDDDDRPSHFVRVNTPHPKDLIKKKEAIKQRVANAKDKNTENKPIASTEMSNAVDPEAQQQHHSANDQLPVISARTCVQETGEQQTRQLQGECANESANSSQRIISTMNMMSANRSHVTAETTVSPRSVKKIDFQAKPEIISTESKQDNNNSHVNKHVDFKLAERHGGLINSIDDEESEDLEENEDVEENEEAEHTEEATDGQRDRQIESQAGDENEANNQSNSSGHFKLRRRDTPHHLKGARLNSPKAQQLDPNEMKEILERYTIGANANSISPNDLTSRNQELKVI